MGLWQQYRSFFRSLRRDPVGVGAVLPSGRRLARTMTAPMRGAGNVAMQVLEVGPGTGIVTQQIVRLLPAEARLDIVELQAEFVRLLQHRFEKEDDFRRVREQVQIHHTSLQSFAEQACKAGTGDGQARSATTSSTTRYADSATYDFIISGLPLNNFEPAAIAEIFEIFRALLKPGGTLSYFEYMYVRQLRRLVSLGRLRQRINRLDEALTAPWRHNKYRRDSVWVNIPPAWVHHLEFDRQERPTNESQVRSRPIS